jgi:type IV secretion system protein VirB6
MQATCPSLSSNDAFLTGVLNHIDCQAQTIGQAGYLALARPGSTGALMLTSALTLFIALIGYRMLFDRTPGMRDAVLAAVKIGIVLMLATSWPAFRTLAYNVALNGPASLASDIGGELPGAGGSLTADLQAVDDELKQLAYLGVDGPLRADQAATPATGAPLGANPTAINPALPGSMDQMANDPARNALSLRTARTIYLTSVIASFAVTRLTAGLLLALGPLFALALLFDATRGLFEGWIRTLLGASLGALSTTILLGVEMALIAPWTASLLQDRYGNIGHPEAAIELEVATFGFGIASLLALYAMGKAAYGFRLPAPLRQQDRVTDHQSSRETSDRVVPLRSTVRDERSRATVIADAVASTQRRDLAHSRAVTAGETRGPSVSAAGSPGAAPVPLGQTFRRTKLRSSAGATRRDRTA